MTRSSDRPSRLLVTFADPNSGRSIPIGQLRRLYEGDEVVFEFRYLSGFFVAQKRGLKPFASFPQLDQTYRDKTLFPFFQNRLMSSKRADYPAYLELLGLPPGTTDPMLVLGRSGGERLTDDYALFPLPETDEPWDLLFWAQLGKDVPRQRLEQLCSRTAIEPVALRLEEQNLHVDGLGMIGILPDVYADAVLALAVKRKGDSGNEYTEIISFEHEQYKQIVQLHIERAWPAAKRRPARLLCRLRVDLTQLAEPRLSYLRVYQPIEPGQRSADLGFLPKNTTRVELSLERILVKVAEGGSFEAPTLARPIHGNLRGIPLSDAQARLTYDQEGWLLLEGNDPAIANALQHRSSEDPQSYEVRKTACELELEDHSHVSVESLLVRGTSVQINKGRMTTQWRCELRQWLWWRNENVHSWLVVIEGIKPPVTQNLLVATKKWMGWAGIHVPGRVKEPAITVIRLGDANESDKRPRLGIVVEAVGGLDSPFEMLAAITIILQAAFGFRLPSKYLGLDANGEICAALYMGQVAPESLERSSVFTVTPRYCTIAPALLGDWRSGGRDRVWLAPLLSRLRSNLLGPKRLSEALLCFTAAIPETMVEYQIAKLGLAIRVLVRTNHTQCQTDQYLNLDSVWEAVSALAQGRRIILPAGAQDALALSHRMALLGDYGIADTPGEVDAFIRNGQLLSAIDTLRATFASLLAGICGYHGPVALRLAADRISMERHQPREMPDTNAQHEDEQLALQVFQAGDEEDAYF